VLAELRDTGEGYSRLWHLRANISMSPLADPMRPGRSCTTPTCLCTPEVAASSPPVAAWLLMVRYLLNHHLIFRLSIDLLIRRRSSPLSAPPHTFHTGCARCGECAPRHLGHSPTPVPVVPCHIRVGARLPSCGAAVDAPPPPAHGSFERRGARALGGGEGRCVFAGAHVPTSRHQCPALGRSTFVGRSALREQAHRQAWAT
jgi:hypothetical protein